MPVGVHRALNVLHLAEHRRGDHRPRAHQLHQPRDVLAVVAVAHVDGQVLVHRLADRERVHGRRVDADDRQRPRLGHRLHRPAERLRGGVTRFPAAILLGRFRRVGRLLASERLDLLLGILSRRPALGALGIDADGVDHPVDADAAGQPPDRLHRMLAVEVDHLGPLAAGGGQPVLDAVDGEHAAGAEQPGGEDRELSHRAAPEHRHGVAVADLGDVGAEIAGGEDVGDQNRVLVAHLVGQLDQPHVGVRDARLVGLQPVERAAGLGAAEEGGAGLGAVGVGLGALGVVAGPAVGAGAAGDRGGNHHPIADLEIAHVLAQALDHPHALAAQDRPRPHPAHRAADEVQVRAADRARDQPHDRLPRVVIPRTAAPRSRRAAAAVPRLAVDPLQPIYVRDAPAGALVR